MRDAHVRQGNVPLVVPILAAALGPIGKEPPRKPAVNTLLPIAHLITNNDLEQIVVYSKSIPQYRQHSGQHSFLAHYSSKSKISFGGLLV
jgi:hypothetical protein